MWVSKKEWNALVARVQELESQTRMYDTNGGVSRIPMNQATSAILEHLDLYLDEGRVNVHPIKGAKRF